jgi:hypothetical protein
MTRSFQEALDQICDVERTRGLLQYQVDGWCAWPLIRFETSLLLTGLTFARGQPDRRFRRGVRALRGLPSLLWLPHRRHVIKTYSSGLIETVDQRYRDVWFDDVMTTAGSVFKIEVENRRQFAGRSRHALIKRNISGAAIDAAAALWRVSPGAEVASASRIFAATLRDDLGLTSIDDSWVSRRLYRFTSSKRMYRSILRRVRPEFVVVADPGEHALVAAGKEQGCSVLELQHGIADVSNASYVWPLVATAHRSQMPIPDRLLLYGEHWRHELHRCGFWGESLRVVGSPRVDRYREQPSRRSTDACTIVFTTQGLDVGLVTSFLRDALQRLIPGLSLRLVVKLHPIYDSDPQPYREAFAPFAEHVDVLSADEGASTFELLHRANLHVSIASASHYDAVGLGVPTIVLPFRTHESVLPMVRAGHASLAQTTDELATLIRNWQDLKVSTAVSEYYFRSGARVNILRELNLLSSDVRN